LRLSPISPTLRAFAGLAKSYGERLRGCNVRNMNPEKGEGLSPELQVALEPLLNAIESLSERIAEYNEQIETLAERSYPQAALLKQQGWATLIRRASENNLVDPPARDFVTASHRFPFLKA
jgi:transposase